MPRLGQPVRSRPKTTDGGIPLDLFHDAKGWLPFASGQVRLDLSHDAGPGGDSLRMDFEFVGGGGFAAARKVFRRRLPDAFAFRFRLRGKAPPNIFEFKLVDPSGKNVWRFRQEAFAPDDAWREMRLRTGEIEFAWGPAGGGTIRRLGAIEFVVAAGSGGRGTLRIQDLRLEDLTPPHPPLATASSESRGREARRIFSLGRKAGWRAARPDRAPRLQLDFGQPREYGGLVIDWDPACRARTFAVQASDDARRWRTLESIARSRGSRSFIRLAGGASRFLRLAFRKTGALGPPAIRRIDVRAPEFGRSETEYFHAIASLGPRGHYPRYLYREQSYWTCAGIPDGDACAIMSEEGMVEPRAGSFSLEPFLFFRDRLITWADARIAQGLEHGCLPIPSSIWRADGITLRVTAFAQGPPDEATLLVRYRLQSVSRQTQRVRLLVAIRPFQVTPPWQAWRDLGGVSHIRSIRWRSGTAWVNGAIPVVPITSPVAFGAAAFHEGPLTDRLARGQTPESQRADDPTGLASAALRFDLRLTPDTPTDILLATPLARTPAPGLGPLRRALARHRHADPLESAIGMWDSRLRTPQVSLPASARASAATCLTAIAQILVNRDGPAIQPGPRRYTRSWIRDGAIMSAALLRAGLHNEVREYIQWYASHQRGDGFVPCCVDRDGPDWLVEHDSHGQLIYAIMEYFRFTRDRAFLEAMWPAASKACRIIGELRAQRLTPDFDSPEKRACRGLLPESASHEGYLAHPVHSYWDDFWAIRGLKDAASMARALAREADAGRIASLCDALRESVRASLAATIASRGIDYVPGSVEWADFDPTATANAVSLINATDDLPAQPLRAMFDRYLSDFRRKRRGELRWNNYSAYEVRIIGALLRLGLRDGAIELLRFFLADRRPRAWNQWPEISWRDPRSPGHIGDVPHTWIGAEYALAFLSLFAFESETDDTLVVGAGIDPSWTETGDGIAIRGLRTWYGMLDLAMSRRRAGSLRIRLSGDISLPAGGIVLHLPLRAPAATATLNGRPAQLEAAGRMLPLREFPAEVIAKPRG